MEKEKQMAVRQFFYWLLAGALIGFGLIGLLSIRFPFLLVGCGLALYGIIRSKFREFWASLVGFGSLPAIILVAQLAGSTVCTVTSSGVTDSSSSGSSSCYPLSYYSFAIFFGCIASLGAAWPLLRVLLRRLRPQS